MNWAEIIDSTDDSARWLTAGEGEREEMEDGSSIYVFKGLKQIGYRLIKACMRLMGSYQQK